MPSATTSSLRAGCVALLVLGLVDLGLLNFYLAPAAFPPSRPGVETPDKPAVAQTPSQPGSVSDPGTPPSTPPPVKPPPTEVATAAPPAEGGEVAGGEEPPPAAQAGEEKPSAGEAGGEEPGSVGEQKPTAVAAGTSAGEENVAAGHEGAGADEAPAPPPISRKTTILFGTSEYLLSAGSKRRLNRLAEKLARAPAISEIRVLGHADKRGESNFNLALSQKRAEVVAEYLAQLGVAQSKLSAKGLGDQVPATQGNTPAALARNRRVEIIIPQGDR